MSKHYAIFFSYVIFLFYFYVNVSWLEIIIINLIFINMIWIQQVLVGNRLHLAFKRQVDQTEAESYAEKNHMGFYEVRLIVLRK